MTSLFDYFIRAGWILINYIIKAGIIRTDYVMNIYDWTYPGYMGYNSFILECFDMGFII